MKLRIGQSIKNKRLEQSLTQQELADFLNVSKASVSKWETGQTYPDITLLPLIASYFSITIDELIRYETQLSNNDVQDIINSFKRSVDKDTVSTYNEVIKLSRSYWSCYPFLVQVAIFMLNHIDILSKVIDKTEIYNNIKELLDRVINNSNDSELIYFSKVSISFTSLIQEQSEEVFKYLGTQTPILLNPEVLIANSYMQNNDIESADIVLQSSLYQYLALMLSTLSNYLPVVQQNMEKFKQTLAMSQKLIDAFDLSELHPFTIIPLYIQAAMILAGSKDNEECIKYIELLVNIIENTPFPYTLHGNEYFNKVQPWIDSQSSGHNTPRNYNLTLSDLASVLDNPIFEDVKSTNEYIELKQRLIKHIERIKNEH